MTGYFRHVKDVTSAFTTYNVEDLGVGYVHTFLVQAKVGGQWSKIDPNNYASATPEGTDHPTLNDPVVTGMTISLT